MKAVHWPGSCKQGVLLRPAGVAPIGAAAAEAPPAAEAALPAAFGRPTEGMERAGRAVVADFLNKARA